MLYENIKKLVQYGVETGLTPACEKNYTINLLLDVFKEDEYVAVSYTHLIKIWKDFQEMFSPCVINGTGQICKLKKISHETLSIAIFVNNILIQFTLFKRLAIVFVGYFIWSPA